MPTTKRKRWEYGIVQGYNIGSELRALGEDGWELVCSGGPKGLVFIFKREKLDAAD